MSSAGWRRNLLFALFFGLATAFRASALTPEAENLLELLEEKAAAGLIGQNELDAFVSKLEDADGCEEWAQDQTLPNDGEFQNAILEVCPEWTDAILAHASDMTRRGATAPDAHARLRVSQIVYPRREHEPSPFVDGRAGETQDGIHGEAEAAWREAALYRRRVREDLPHASFSAGNNYSDWAGTRLPFVVGRRFYAGWSGLSGLAGPLESAYAGLDGLAGEWQGFGNATGAAGAWNRLLPRGSVPFKPGSALSPGRRDALLYAVGWVHHGEPSTPRAPWDFADGAVWRFEAAHQRFETPPRPDAIAPAISTTIAGVEASAPSGRWRVGTAASWLASTTSMRLAGPSTTSLSSADRSPMPMPATGPASGGYLEAALGGKHAGYRVEFHQASRGWTNPLQSHVGYVQDTLGDGLIAPGRGEGGLEAQTRIPIWEPDGRSAAQASRDSDLDEAPKPYTATLVTGGGADWNPFTEEILAGEGRLALLQAWRAWTYEAGAAMHYRRPGLAVPSINSGRFSMAQIATYRATPWYAKASLLAREGGYNGDRPLQGTLSLDHAGANSWGAEILVGDCRNPSRYRRVTLKQGWILGRGAMLRQMLRLPWSGGNVGSDLEYQLLIEMTGIR